MALRSTNKGTRNVLGNGLTTPFRREGGRDFAAASGGAAVESALRQILGTKPGELRWRPSFGTEIEPFRHRNLNSAVAKELGNNVRQAITEWEPRISVARADAKILDGGGNATGVVSNRLDVEVVWRINPMLSSEGSIELPPYSTRERL